MAGGFREMAQKRRPSSSKEWASRLRLQSVQALEPPRAEAALPDEWQIPIISTVHSRASRCASATAPSSSSWLEIVNDFEKRGVALSPLNLIASPQEGESPWREFGEYAWPQHSWQGMP